MVVNIVNELVELGLSMYEAQVYASLVSAGESLGGYELAKMSGIPSSKIYEVISRLETKRVVQPVETGSGRKYHPLEPSEFIARTRMKTEHSLGRLSEGFSSLSRNPRSPVIFNVDDYNILLDKAVRLIDGAENRILISAWSDEFEALADSVSRSVKRGVKAAAVLFGTEREKPGKIFSHPIADTIYSEKGGRSLLVVADSGEALIGTVRSDGSVEGGFSSNEAFVITAEDYIKHDVYMMKIVKRFDAELIRMFGDNYSMLRDVFSDREVK